MCFSPVPGALFWLWLHVYFYLSLETSGPSTAAFGSRNSLFRALFTGEGCISIVGMVVALGWDFFLVSPPFFVAICPRFLSRDFCSLPWVSFRSLPSGRVLSFFLPALQVLLPRGLHLLAV